MSGQLAGRRHTRHQTPAPMGSLASESRRLPAEDRRAQIIQAAIALFAEKGFDGTTTREIAQAAGITEVLIFRHFQTKQDLYSAIIDHKMTRCRPPVREIFAEAAVRGDDRAFFTRLAEEMLRMY